jgi:hypothetical protein
MKGLPESLRLGWSRTLPHQKRGLKIQTLSAILLGAFQFSLSMLYEETDASVPHLGKTGRFNSHPLKYL